MSATPNPSSVLTDIISMRHVSVHYGDAVAVNDVSLDVTSGEWLGLIGPKRRG